MTDYQRRAHERERIRCPVCSVGIRILRTLDHDKAADHRDFWTPSLRVRSY